MINLKAWVCNSKMIEVEDFSLDYEVVEKNTGEQYFFETDNVIILMGSGIEDIHSREIFEGDLLWCPEENYRGKVKFMSGAFYTDAAGFGWQPIGELVDNTFEVVGNIYEGEF